jgi:Tfp pilus assembly PilM family ATPase
MNKKDLNLKFEINLRTRGIGITFDGKRLYLTAIHNKLNQFHYMGYEVLDDFENKSDEEVLDFIDEFQSVHKVRRADMFMALPRSETMVQIAEFPIEARNNLDEVMTYQLENYFPVDIEEWAFFPQIIGQAEQLKVMIVAVKKERLGHVFGFIRRWKLKISGVTLDTLSIVNGLAKSRPNLCANNRIAVSRPRPEAIELIVIDQRKLLGGHYFPVEVLHGHDHFRLDLEVIILCCSSTD